MSILADWKRQRKLKRAFANAVKRQEQEKKRKLILEWYKLLEPFHRQSRRYRGGNAQLRALADDLSRHAIEGVVRWFIHATGALIVLLILLFLLAAPEQQHNPIFLGLLGLGSFISVIAFAFYEMRLGIRHRLEDYADGFWVAHDPFTGKEIYKLMTCPQCNTQNYKNQYLRYLEPCEYCGHNIDWEAAKQR